MKHYLKKYHLAIQEMVFTTPLEIIEDIVEIKLRPSKIVHKAFAIKNQKVDLDFIERSHPGSEVTYIYSAQRKF